MKSIPSFPPSRAEGLPPCGPNHPLLLDLKLAPKQRAETGRRSVYRLCTPGVHLVTAPPLDDGADTR